jgi:hypothetical protein
MTFADLNEMLDFSRQKTLALVDQAVVLPARSQRSIDFCLILENLNFPTPVLFIDDARQLAGLIVVFGQDEQGVGVPMILGKIAQFDQTGREQMASQRRPRAAFRLVSCSTNA